VGEGDEGAGGEEGGGWGVVEAYTLFLSAAAS